MFKFIQKFFKQGGNLEQIRLNHPFDALDGRTPGVSRKPFVDSCGLAVGINHHPDCIAEFMVSKNASRMPHRL